MLIDLGNKALLRDMLGTNLREVLPVNRMSRIQRIGAKNTARKFPGGQIQKNSSTSSRSATPSIVFANGHICSSKNEHIHSRRCWHMHSRHSSRRSGASSGPFLGIVVH